MNFNYGISTVVYDDGLGPALYVCGQFELIGPDGTSVKDLAKWDGEQWVQVPVIGPVYHLSIEDFGSGPELLATGIGMLPYESGLSRNLGAWDGTQWRRFPELPSVGEFRYVYRGVVFNGTGDRELYVIICDNSFASDTPSFGGSLYRLEAGNTWRVVDDSTELLNSSGIKVTALEVHDDGTGEALYLGGRNFFLDGNPNARFGIVRWDGKAWSSVPEFGNPTDGWVRNLHSIQRNGANELIASGNFFSVNGSPADGIAIFRDGSWSTPGADGLDPIPARSYVDLYASCVLPIKGTDELVVAGWLSGAGGLAASNIARWDGATWQPLQDPSPNEVFGTVKTMAEVVVDDAPALIVGGQFTSQDQPDSRSIAALNDGGWASLGAGFDLEVRATTSVDHGDGPELYAGGCSVSRAIHR